MRRTLNIISLITSAAALLASVWIVFPAPAYNVWLFSVAASEWSLALVALAVFGIMCGLLERVFGGGKRLWLVSSCVGIVAVLFALYPLFSSMFVAREHGVSLSLRQYITGSSGDADDRHAPSERLVGFKTYTFASVDGVALRLDAYLPPDDVERNGAGVIVVHGGSWSAGERSDFPQWNRWLAREGFAVFDIDYRLAPQPNWQTATGDVKCAVRWVKRHAAEFHISPDRLALMGRSAGGHLALLAAYTSGDTRLPASYPLMEDVEDTHAPTEAMPALPSLNTSTTDESVRAVVSFYGPTDLPWAYDHPANQRVLDGPGAIRRLLGGSPDSAPEMRELYGFASPVAHVNAHAPPTLLIHGGHDQLVLSDNMEMLCAKLKEARVTSRRIYLPYAQHGFDYNFNGWGAQIVRPVMLDFLRAETASR